ncbi:MAG TPA: hypothetical protein VEH04_09155 [Verrucomicrobiae bacterium]|nr:hypothetical protein [Verrucomicrobiae bacterium]
MNLLLRTSLILNMALGIAVLASFIARKPLRKHAVAASLPSNVEAERGQDERNEPLALEAAQRQFDWEALCDADLKVYRQNLEAVGCPSQTIADIIVAEINERFHARREVLIQSCQARYWDLALKGEAAIRSECCPPLDALAAERQAMIQDVLGDRPRVSEPVSANHQTSAVAEATATPDLENAGTDARLLGSRESLWAADLSGFEPTREEWRLVTQLRMEWVDAQQELDQQELPHEEKFRRGEQLQADLDARIREVLGEERHAEYELAKDGAFQELHRVAERYGLAREVAAQAHHIARTTQQQLETLRNNSALSEQIRRATIERVLKEAKQSLQETMGARALATYGEHGGDWLTSGL